MSKKIITFFQQNIIPNLYAFDVEKILNDKVKKLKEKEFEIEKGEQLNHDNLILELKEYLQKERDRKKIIEDKAVASIFVISLSVTFILGSFDFIKDTEGGIIFKFIIFSILIAGVIYLLMSGITSIKALNIREFYDEYLEGRTKKNGNTLHFMDLDNKKRCSQFYKNIELNQLITNIRSNYVYATFIGIRNGIILISIFFIVMVGHTYFINLVHNNYVDFGKIKQLENEVSQLSNQLIQQKDIEIKKLTDQIGVKQKELNTIKNELVSLNGTLDSIKKEIESNKKESDSKR